MSPQSRSKTATPLTAHRNPVPKALLYPSCENTLHDKQTTMVNNTCHHIIQYTISYTVQNTGTQIEGSHRKVRPSSRWVVYFSSIFVISLVLTLIQVMTFLMHKSRRTVFRLSSTIYYYYLEITFQLDQTFTNSRNAVTNTQTKHGNSKEAQRVCPNFYF